MAPHPGRMKWCCLQSRTVQKEKGMSFRKWAVRPEDLGPASGATTWLDELALPPKQTCSEEQRMLFENWARALGLGPRVWRHELARWVGFDSKADLSRRSDIVI